jgi:hypothetical protein
MPIFVTPAVEHNVYTDEPNVFNIAGGAALMVLVSEQNSNKMEVSQRLIQNCSANNVYYSENLVSSPIPQSDANIPPVGVCDNINNFHGIIGPYQQLDCTSHKQCVTVYAPSAATISTTIRRRSNK